MQSTRPSQPRAQRPREVYLHDEPAVKPRRSSQRFEQPSHRRALLSSLPLVIGLVIVWLLLFGLNSRIFGQAANDNSVFLPLVSQGGTLSTGATPVSANSPSTPCLTLRLPDNPLAQPLRPLDLAAGWRGGHHSPRNIMPAPEYAASGNQRCWINKSSWLPSEESARLWRDVWQVKPFDPYMAKVLGQ